MLVFAGWTLSEIPALAAAGAALSAGAFLLLAFLWLDRRRRAAGFRPWRIAGRGLSPAAVARAWAWLLPAAFLAGLWGMPLASTTRAVGPDPRGEPVEAAARTAAEAAAGAALVPARATTTRLRLPFWIRSTFREETAEGRKLAGTVRHTLQLPWPFLLAALLYGILRPRRDPGRRRRRHRRRGSDGRRGPDGRRRPDRWPAGRVALAVLGAAALAAPAPRYAAAEGCGGSDGQLCYVRQTCERKFLIIKQCTTEYGYYPDYL